jgi:hypothetical protein
MSEVTGNRTIIDKLLKPGSTELFWFSLLLFLPITAGLWFTSAIVHGQIILLYIFFCAIGCGLILLAFLIDKLFHVALHRYSIRGVALFVLLILVELPIHAGLQALSDKDGDKIRRSVEEFHKYNGYYPDDLSDSGFDDLPRRSWTFSFYEYDRELQPYRIRYNSIGGEERFYSHQYQMWTYPFDE